MRNRLLMNKTYLGIGLLTLIGLILLAAFRGDGNGAATAVAANQPQAPIAQTSGDVVSAEGQIVPLFSADLAFQTGGVVAEILVAEDDLVQTGDPLVRLETADLEIALDQAQARLGSAEAGLTAAQNQLALAQAGIATAQGQVTVAEANLALVQAGPLPEEIAAAEANLAVAEAGVVQAAGNRDQALNIADESDILQAEAGLAQATAELRALEENYQDILDACFTTPNGDEVCPLYGPVEEAARDQLAVARLNQEAAQARLDFLRGGPTTAQTQAANSGVAVAIANRDAAQAQLDLLLAGPQPERVRIAEVGVEQAQVGVTLAEVNVVEAEAAVSQAEAGVAAAQAAVDAAQAQLDRMTLAAPFNGRVARINVAEGELVAGSTPVLTMADFSGWLVETTNLTELDVALVDAGADVSVRLDAIPDATLTGTVTEIGLVAGLSQGDVVYDVTIRLDPVPDLPVRWGMTAFVDIAAE